ncbi:YibE/F family protein [Arthrobacter psychrochitiniphilus]|uniref:YibE/F family protein n=1 Tax=Arthrobacter psychrochitiniphilus TaxID=291045 RepID=A0A2V3DX93_9MICC|nr:YibE/F family protein [Arthrobacter psychrochitiniphilus]NYG16752.1 putative membrane protein [Arthrobacter psychrochitiniphilus]PXA69150.1 YibE/F family protein [Arthrobacter psychrochitiniphilus]
MGHSHSHADESALSRPELRRRKAMRRRAVVLLSWILVPLAILTIIAMALMWPSTEGSPAAAGNPYAAAPGASIDSGTVQRTVTEDCSLSAGGSPGSSCFIAFTAADGLAEVPVLISPDIVQSRGVHVGDSIRYLNLSGLAAVTGVEQNGPAYVFMDFVRTFPIGLLAVLYAVVVVAVARWRGLRAIVGLIGAFGVLAWFILPALAQGQPPLLVALTGSSAIMFGVLYFAHGFSARTSTALLGTLFGLGVTAGLAAWAVDAAALTGTSGEYGYQLLNMTQGMSLSGMILCGLVISGLGVLNDVTITQSSAVWELYELAPETSTRELFTSAMRIGRDHIASTVYTIAFAYAGSALPVLLMVSLFDQELLLALTGVELAEEIVRILVGSIGLVLAIPVTTLVAVAVVKATGRVRAVQVSTDVVHGEAPGSKVLDNA